MAIFYCKYEVVSRKSGRSSVAAAAYRSGKKITNELDGVTHNYEKKENVEYSEIITPKNAPEWAKNRSTLWNEVEKSEKRKDARTARECIVALPIEFDLEKNIELVREFSQVFANEGMVVDFSIHNKEGNPHAHILLTTRELDGEEFGLKNRKWNSKEKGVEWKIAWEKTVNREFERLGLDTRISHKLEEDFLPQKHLGQQAHQLELKGIKTKKGDYNRGVKEYNAELTKEKQRLEAKKKLLTMFVKIDHDQNELRISQIRGESASFQFSTMSEIYQDTCINIYLGLKKGYETVDKTNEIKDILLKREIEKAHEEALKENSNRDNATKARLEAEKQAKIEAKRKEQLKVRQEVENTLKTMFFSVDNDKKILYISEIKSDIIKHTYSDYDENNQNAFIDIYLGEMKDYTLVDRTEEIQKLEAENRVKIEAKRIAKQSILKQLQGKFYDYKIENGNFNISSIQGDYSSTRWNFDDEPQIVKDMYIDKILKGEYKINDITNEINLEKAIETPQQKAPVEPKKVPISDFRASEHVKSQKEPENAENELKMQRYIIGVYETGMEYVYNPTEKDFVDLTPKNCKNLAFDNFLNCENLYKTLKKHAHEYSNYTELKVVEVKGDYFSTNNQMRIISSSDLTELREKSNTNEKVKSRGGMTM